MRRAGTNATVANACIAIGPPVRCATTTDGSGRYLVSLDSAPPGIGWDVHFLEGGLVKLSRPGIVVNGPTQVDATIP